ncbi:hypothetical protein CL630_01800 [bacterium]|nr:hypothetical protein [bacterium]|tara:strand:- start:19625 stop:20539 length:915 start_codon:yes stop_codon:yes gene_type:complete
MDNEQKTPEEKKEGQDTFIKRLRTYKYDISEALKQQKQSFTGMVIAEKKRQEKSGVVQPEQTRKIFTPKNIFIGLGILLVVLAIGVSAFMLLRAKAPEQVISPSLDIQSPVFLENHKTISIERFNENEIRGKVEVLKREENMPIDSILGITFTKTIETLEGEQTALLSTSELFSMLGHETPRQLIRTFNDPFLFGFHAFRKTEPFLILTNRFYDGAFLGMLQWEPFMLSDLSPMFLLERTDFSRTQLFEDVVIQNNDVRILKNTNNETKLLYSFVDRNTIVITTNTDAFKEIVTRLKTPQKMLR